MCRQTERELDSCDIQVNTDRLFSLFNIRVVMVHQDTDNNSVKMIDTTFLARSQHVVVETCAGLCKGGNSISNAKENLQ